MTAMRNARGQRSGRRTRAIISRCSMRGTRHLVRKTCVATETRLCACSYMRKTFRKRITGTYSFRALAKCFRSPTNFILVSHIGVYLNC